MEKTGSSRTSTGNIRAVRLNTYRERKRECIELEKEVGQLVSTVTELRQVVTDKAEKIKILEAQVEDQKMICSRFSQLEGQAIRVPKLNLETVQNKW